MLNNSKTEGEITSWEAEVYSRRHESKVYEQDQIINAMESKISLFDYRIQCLLNNRFTTDVKSKLMDIFFITLHQELLVLKEFEAVENKLEEKVKTKHIEVMDMQDLIQTVDLKINEEKKRVSKLRETEKNICSVFLQTIHDNKFIDFLKKVFKKKSKPPKEHKDDGEYFD